MKGGLPWIVIDNTFDGYIIEVTTMMTCVKIVERAALADST